MEILLFVVMPPQDMLIQNMCSQDYWQETTSYLIAHIKLSAIALSFIRAQPESRICDPQISGNSLPHELAHQQVSTDTLSRYYHPGTRVGTLYPHTVRCNPTCTPVHVTTCTHRPTHHDNRVQDDSAGGGWS